jgi:hypothetical protein
LGLRSLPEEISHIGPGIASVVELVSFVEPEIEAEMVPIAGPVDGLHARRVRDEEVRKGKCPYIHEGVEEVAPDWALGDIGHLRLLGCHRHTCWW